MPDCCQTERLETLSIPKIPLLTEGKDKKTNPRLMMRLKQSLAIAEYWINVHKGKALTKGEMRVLFTTGHGSSAVSLFLSATAVSKAPAPPGQLPRAESKTQELIAAYMQTYNRWIQSYYVNIHYRRVCKKDHNTLNLVIHMTPVHLI